MAAAAVPALNTPRATWPLFVLAAALRLVRLNGAVVGVHSWRQADTAAIARHFAEGQMQWWLPQIDWAGAGAGYVESEFPLYPYLLAWLYRLAGVHEFIARGLSLVCSLLTLWLLLRIGQRLLNPSAAWWGGLIWALVPLAVYYGRSVQAESLMLLMAALCLERFLAWQDDQRPLNLWLAWLGFTLCGLLKVLPLIWLGLPLCWLWGQRRGWGSLIRPLPIVLFLGSFGCTAAWYHHAHELGQLSGLSFGFWAGDTNRYSWSQLLGPAYWLNIGLRFSLRGLAVIGLPLLAMGLAAVCSKSTGAVRQPVQPGGGIQPQDPRARVLVVGLGSVLLAGALAPESSAVHEYYQLPLLLFACPLIGLGLAQLHDRHRLRWLLLALLTTASLLSLSLDYWRVEAQQQRTLSPLAESIQRNTAPQERIVSVTGSDPTLLNLARRQGWLIKPTHLTAERLEQFRQEGASAIATSFQLVESYRSFNDQAVKTRLLNLLCSSQNQTQRLAGSQATLPTETDCPADRSYAVVRLSQRNQAQPANASAARDSAEPRKAASPMPGPTRQAPDHSS